MKRKLRVGIVGCGGIARAHVAAYTKAANVEIAMVYDVVEQAAATLAEQVGADVAGSLKKMAADGGLDAVSVCTPPAVHLDNCKPFLKHGVGVLCEKPLEANVDNAVKLARAVKRSDSVFMVAFCHRFHPAVIELKKLIKRGTLGDPILFRNIFGGYSSKAGNHRADPKLSGGGTNIDNGAHSVDLFRFLVGDPTHVQSLSGNVMQDLAVEDFGMIQLGVANKSFGQITTSYSVPCGGAWIEWHGTKGSATISYWNPGHPDLAVKKAGGDWQPVDCSKHPERFDGEVGHFLKCVRRGETPRITADDGVKINRLMAAVYQSVDEGATVKVKL